MQKKISLMAIILALSLVLAACAGEPPALPVTGPATTEAAPSSASPTQTTAGTDRPTATPTSPAANTKMAAPKSTAPQKDCASIPLAGAILFILSSPNGSASSLAPLDPASGLPVCGSENLKFRGNYTYGLSQDRKMLAVLNTDVDGSGASALNVIDLQTWQSVEVQIDSLKESSALAINPARTQIAIAQVNPPRDWTKPPSYTLALVDLAGQKIVAQRPLSFSPRLLKYTQDGSGILVYGGDYAAAAGAKPQASALLLDAGDLHTLWQPALRGVHAGGTQPPTDGSDPIFDIWEPGYALTADGSTLYIVHSDENVLTTVDFARRVESQVPIQPRLSWLDRLLSWTAGLAYAKGGNGTTKQAQLSQDGSRLYVIGSTENASLDSHGNMQLTQTPLGLQAIDPASGAELAKLDTAAYNFYLSPDGSAIYLDNWEDPSYGAQVVEAGSLKVTRQMEKLNLTVVKTIGGQPVVLAQSRFDQMTSLDPGSLEPVEGTPAHPWSMNGYPLLTLP